MQAASISQGNFIPVMAVVILQMGTDIMNASVSESKSFRRSSHVHARRLLNPCMVFERTSIDRFDD